MFGQDKGLFQFTFLGFRVHIDWSWLIAIFLISWSLATGYFPAAAGMSSGLGLVILALAASMLLFASVLLHEIGHATVAVRNGIRILGIRLFIFGGVAQLAEEPDRPETELKITIAGPAVSAGLAVLAWFLMHAAAAMDAPALTALMQFLAGANLSMVLFNMIPGFPMDGGRLLRAALWKYRGSYLAATKTAATAGKVIAGLFIAFGLISGLSGAGLGGLWLSFIGLFLYQAANASLIHARMRNGELEREFEVDEWFDTPFRSRPRGRTIITIRDGHTVRHFRLD